MQKKNFFVQSAIFQQFKYSRDFSHKHWHFLFLQKNKQNISRCKVHSYMRYTPHLSFFRNLCHQFLQYSILQKQWVLYISVNSHFQHFLCKKGEKSKRFAPNFCKKHIFLSLHQNQVDYNNTENQLWPNNTNIYCIQPWWLSGIMNSKFK